MIERYRKKIERYRKKPINTIRIDVAATGSYGKRGPWFTATCVVDGRRFDIKSLQPLLDMARVLEKAGVAPESRIEMWRAESTAPALTSTVGRAAQLMVREGLNTAPRFAKWMPHYREDREEEG